MTEQRGSSTQAPSQRPPEDPFSPSDWSRIEGVCGWRPGRITKPPADLGETNKLLSLKDRILKDRAMHDIQKLHEFYKRRGLL